MFVCRVSGFVNQATIQVAIAEELITSIRNGNYTSTLGKPKSLVLVGHSFGSIITAAVVTANPSITEGLILTGKSNFF
jgi:alpha-beta hydrolase superfamily lysophospholipase